MGQDGQTPPLSNSSIFFFLEFHL